MVGHYGHYNSQKRYAERPLHPLHGPEGDLDLLPNKSLHLTRLRLAGERFFVGRTGVASTNCGVQDTETMETDSAHDNINTRAGGLAAANPAERGERPSDVHVSSPILTAPASRPFEA